MEKQNAWSMSLMLTMAAEAAVGATSRHEPETLTPFASSNALVFSAQRLCFGTLP